MAVKMRFAHCLCVTRTMEPQCFDQTLPESHKCGPPPPLINGYIMVNMVTLHFKAVCFPTVQYVFWGLCHIKRNDLEPVYTGPERHLYCWQ